MKKGFTLIELLAVIVILAIIALIATPIVLNIIDDTKESSTLRCADFYLDAVEFSVANSTLNNKKIKDDTYNVLENGNICLEYDEDDNCIDTLEVEVKGEKPNSGTITITNGEISGVNIILNKKEIIKNNEGKLVYKEEKIIEPGKFDSVCTYLNNEVAEKTAGAKYSCKVDPNKEPYTFYVLTTPKSTDTSINLIMDQNINSDGTPAGITGVTQSTNASRYNLVAWISSSTYGCGSDGNYCATNEKGPITAMQFLYNATKDWTNVDPVNYTYNDKATQGTTSADTSYTSFVSINGVATITSLSGAGVTIGSEATPLRARMPIRARDTSITEVTSKKNASYLYEYLPSSSSEILDGYWTLSTAAHSVSAYCVSGYAGDDSTAFVSHGNDVYFGFHNGVRPVINLKL